MIRNAGILGLGALGGMYGYFISEAVGSENLFVLGESKRLERYARDGVYINGERYEFNYSFDKKPLDLIIVATKFHQLENALENLKGYVNEDTIIISLLNGVTSEDVIKKATGCDNVLYCVAYGMDAQKYGNHIRFKNYGTLAVGEKDNSVVSQRLKRLTDFFDSINFSYEVPVSMINKLWSKFMLNAGINQVCAAYGLKYKDVQREGIYRDKMVAAMREVIAVAEKMNIPLGENDVKYWLDVTDRLYSESMPSMAQDILNKNKTEVEIFADTVVDISRKYGIKAPVNEELGSIIHKKEKSYEL